MTSGRSSGEGKCQADIRVEQPIVKDYLKQMGKYAGDLSPGEIGNVYVEFKKSLKMRGMLSLIFTGE